MLRRIAHIILSAWLSVLLLFGGTAKEFIHQFASHKDTVHCSRGENGLVIESQHHHCIFLQFSLASFLNDIDLPFIARITTGYIIHNSLLQVILFHNDIPALFLRGPPIALA